MNVTTAFLYVGIFNPVNVCVATTLALTDNATVIEVIVELPLFSILIFGWNEPGQTGAG